MTFIDEARKVIKKAFKDWVDAERVTRSVRLPADDPGEWAPSSLLIVGKEEGIPDRFFYPNAFPVWEKVEKELSVLLGKDVYFEDVNAAISALYQVE